MVYLDCMNDFLFVCTANMLRSPTCEHVARSKGFSADSAGTDQSIAIRPLTVDAIRRARLVVCMELAHAQEVEKLWRAAQTLEDAGFPKIVVWNIPDDYNYCQPGLIKIIERKLAETYTGDRK